MPWLFLVLALVALMVAMTTKSILLAVVCILIALGLILAWVMGLLANRIDTRTRDESVMLDPAELRRLREQAEARRAAREAAGPQVGSTPQPAAPIWPHERNDGPSSTS